MDFNTSDKIALLALLVAVLAAIYARWSSLEAEKANQISLINGRKEIYLAFINLKMHMLQQRQGAQLTEVSKFYHHTITAHLFFPASLAKKIQDYYDACFWLADSYQLNGDATLENSNKDKQSKYLDTQSGLSLTIDTEILKLFKALNN